MKNLLRVFLLAIFMLFVVNAFAVQTSVNTSPKAQQVQIQAAPTFHITTPLHKTDGKSQLVAALLAFFLGTLGIHNFYLGYKKKGMTQLLLTLGGYVIGIVGGIIAAGGASAGSAGAALLGTIISTVGWIVVLAVAIWALIDFIKILTGDLKPADGDYAETL